MVTPFLGRILAAPEMSYANASKKYTCSVYYGGITLPDHMAFRLSDCSFMAWHYTSYLRNNNPLKPAIKK
jgi:hypothetical protein